MKSKPPKVKTDAEKPKAKRRKPAVDNVETSTSDHTTEELSILKSVDGKLEESSAAPRQNDVVADGENGEALLSAEEYHEVKRRERLRKQLKSLKKKVEEMRLRLKKAAKKGKKKKVKLLKATLRAVKADRKELKTAHRGVE
jgi:hypothetical protein